MKNRRNENLSTYEVGIPPCEFESPMVGELLECPECKRKILVERALLGTNHTMTTMAVCWECLDLEKQETATKQYGL